MASFPGIALCTNIYVCIVHNVVAPAQTFQCEIHLAAHAILK